MLSGWFSVESVIVFGFLSKKFKVLLVDDNLGLTKALSKFLDHHGFKTQVVHSAEALRGLFAGKQPEVVILDIKLADVNGIDLIPEILSHWKGVPIIMLTGLGYDDELMKQAMERGARGYVSKSLTPDEVLAAITRTIEHPEHHG